MIFYIVLRILFYYFAITFNNIFYIVLQFFIDNFKLKNNCKNCFVASLILTLQTLKRTLYQAMECLLASSVPRLKFFKIIV